MKLVRVVQCLFVLSFSSSLFGQVEVSSPETSDSTIEISDEEMLEEEEEIETYGCTRIINGHSVETLGKGVLEFRIEHRFDDIAGSDGGAQTLYGFDNSTDIRFGFEYGVTDRLMIGIGRCKGTASLGKKGAPYKALLDGFVKYRLLHQDKKTPFSMTFIGTSSYTYMKASDDEYSVSHFPKHVHRFAYSSQLNIARKFGERFSAAIMPTLVHRNYVASDDINALFSLGGSIRYTVNSKVGIVLEYYHNIHNNDIRKSNINSFGIAFEWMTFGHNFTVNLTNSVGIGETQFIPYTFQNWSKGQFRLGFCIGRKYMRE